MNELNGDVLFQKSSGSERIGEDKFEVKQEYVTLISKPGGILVINIKAPKVESIGIHGFFEGLTDMEPITMNIANTGDIKCYFKGISPVVMDEEEESVQKFSVTFQELHDEI